MERPPRSPRESLFSRRTLGISLGQRVSVLALLAFIFPTALYLGEGEAEARALAFTTLIVANLALIFTNRSWSQTVFKTWRLPNTALWWVVGGVLVGLPLVLYLPLLRQLFLFSTLNLLDLALCLVAGLVSIGWFEFLKYWRNRPAQVETGQRVPGERQGLTTGQPELSEKEGAKK